MSIWKKCLGRKDCIDWEPRKDFGDPKPVDKNYRAEQEKEAKQDLQKPIWQLVCDVHEEANNKERKNLKENLIHATKRMVSMMGKVASDNERTQKKLVYLNTVLTVLTLVLASDFIQKAFRWFLGFLQTLATAKAG